MSALFKQPTSHSVGTNKEDHFALSVSNDGMPSSTFNREQTHLTTFNASEVIPFYIDEVLPGDTHEISIDFLSRMTTYLFPVMDKLELDFYFFFVPNRIVFSGWQALMGEVSSGNPPFFPSANPAPVPSYVPPVSGTSAVIPVQGLADYYGFPSGTALVASGTGNSIPLNILPFRGYWAIWNRWFRDQNLQPPYPVKVDATNDDLSTNFLAYPYKACKKHDYFTSSLYGSLKPVSTPGVSGIQIPWLSGIDPLPLTINLIASQLTSASGDGLAPGTPVPPLTGATAAPGNFIQMLRNAFQLNKYLERDARAGTRYIEIVKSHFGVSAEDYRLQYPEFLHHYHSYVGVTQVPQTSSTDETSPQGNLSAFSLTVDHTKPFKKTFVEHGYVHGLVCARQRKTYQQGVERFWRRRERFHFYSPEFAHISEQPVYTSEIWSQDVGTTQDQVFGYQEAWADYRFKPSRTSGCFRSGNSLYDLSAWHYGDFYTARPLLSAAFISDNSQDNVDRTLAVSSGSTGVPQILMQLRINNRTTRKMPVYSIPEFADHF